ncbi:hypothetical protein HKD37_15G043683 [Glycine soja]
MLPSCCTAEQNNFHKEPSMVPQSRISSPLKHNLIALRSPHSALRYCTSLDGTSGALVFGSDCIESNLRTILIARACAVECEINLDRFLQFYCVTLFLYLDRNSVIMSGKYIISAILGSFGVAWVCDYYVSEKKLFGGSTPGTITNNEWAEETDKKLQAWPRTAGPPVVMNPISRRNFIVKSRPE